MIRWKRTNREHHLHQREDAELNLIPLIDILSVMVAFLLVYSVDVEVVQNSKGVEIPQSTTDVLPNHSVVVMITRDQVFVQGELVADLTDIADPRGDVIEPLLAVLLRPMVGIDPAAQVEALASREITVVADKSLPYDIVKMVMTTCTEAAYGKISLAVIERERPASAAALAAT
jgi:biopolymer transport protein ExbD